MLRGLRDKHARIFSANIRSEATSVLHGVKWDKAKFDPFYD